MLQPKPVLRLVLALVPATRSRQTRPLSPHGQQSSMAASDLNVKSSIRVTARFSAHAPCGEDTASSLLMVTPDPEGAAAAGFFAFRAFRDELGRLEVIV